MKYALIIIGLIILAGAIAIFIAPEKSLMTKKTTRELQAGDVNGLTVTVAPKEISQNAPIWVFAITLDTHSGDLSQDIIQAASLIGQNGDEHKSLIWEGDLPGGHHRQGILKFNALKPYPQIIKFKFKGAGGSGETIFIWKI